MDNLKFKKIQDGISSDIVAGYTYVGSERINDIDGYELEFKQRIFPFMDLKDQSSFSHTNITTDFTLRIINNDNKTYIFEDKSKAMDYINDNANGFFRNNVKIHPQLLADVLEASRANGSDNDNWGVNEHGMIFSNTEDSIESYVYAVNTVLGLRSLIMAYYRLSAGQ